MISPLILRTDWCLWTPHSWESFDGKRWLWIVAAKLYMIIDGAVAREFSSLSLSLSLRLDLRVECLENIGKDVDLT
jgi:hypothetical protein